MNTSTFYDLEVMLKYMAVSLQLSPIYIAQLYQVDPYGNFILAGRVTEPPVVSFVNATTGTDGSLSLSLSFSLFLALHNSDLFLLVDSVDSVHICSESDVQSI